VLSPWHTPEASVHISLTPYVANGNPEDEFTASADQIWENGSRPGRVTVSKRREKKTLIALPIGVISAPRIKETLLKEPTRHSIGVTRTTFLATFSSVIPTHFALHPTVNHPTYHRSRQNAYRALTQNRPSNTIRTKDSKLRSPADFRESQA